MPRHGENIYKRKDGRYEGRYVIGRTEKGKTRFGYVYGRRYMDVKKRLLNKKNETSLDKGTQGKEAKKCYQPYTKHRLTGQ